MYTCVSSRKFESVLFWPVLCVHPCVCVCVCACVFSCSSTYIYMHTYIHSCFDHTTSTHTCMHTYIHTYAHNHGAGGRAHTDHCWRHFGTYRGISAVFGALLISLLLPVWLRFSKVVFKQNIISVYMRMYAYIMKMRVSTIYMVSMV